MNIYYSLHKRWWRMHFPVSLPAKPSTIFGLNFTVSILINNIFALRRVLSAIVLTFSCIIFFNVSASAQNVTLKKSKANLETILKDIEHQTPYVFFYKKEDIADIGNINIDIKDASVFEALTTLFKGLDIEYELFEKTIALKKIPKRAQSVIDKRKMKVITRLKGLVVDENELPVKGVIILETKVKTRAVTDEAGKFSIVIGASGSLEVSGEGFAKQIVNYKDTSELYIVMERGKVMSIELNEVAINYNNVKKNPTTMVNLENRNYMNLSQVLQGTIPGLSLQTVNTTTTNITSIDAYQPFGAGGVPIRRFVRFSVEDFLNFYGKRDGQGYIDRMLKGETVQNFKLNTNTTVTNLLVPQIRGANNFSASASNMLIVIDGFPQDGFPANYPMTNVESIEVIKDPKELIKWGARAAGGAILIKTKSAKKGKIDINYNANFYYSPAQKFDRERLGLASPKEFLSYMKEIDSTYSQDYSPTSFNYSPAKQLLALRKLGLINAGQFNSKWDSLGRLDNEQQLNLLQQDKFSQNHSITLSGGSNAYKFTGIGNYSKDQFNEIFKLSP